MTIASYAAARRGLLLYLTLCFSSGGIIFGVVALLTMSGPQRVILFVVFVGTGAGYAYYFGLRTICLVELTSNELRWRSLLRGGAAALSGVRSIRYGRVETRRGPRSVVTVEFTGRKPLTFATAGPGLADFMSSVHAAAPHIAVEPPG
jgi:hypothetical protein